MTQLEEDVRVIIKLLKKTRGIQYTWMARTANIKYGELIAFLNEDKHYNYTELNIMRSLLHEEINDKYSLIVELFELEKKNIKKEEGSPLDVNEELNLRMRILFNYLIHEKGVSQSFLAKKSGLTRQNFNRWLNHDSVQNRTLYKLLGAVEHRNSNVGSLKRIAYIKLYIEY